MSTTHLPEALPLMCQDTSQGAEVPSVDPFCQAQATVYPSIYPFSGSSQPHLAFPPNSTFPPFPSYPSSLHRAGGINCVPNYQSYCTTYTPAPFIPSMQDQFSSLYDASSLASSLHFDGMSVGTATSTTYLLSSEHTGHHEQSRHVTSQFPPPLQHTAVPVQGQQQVRNEFFTQPEAAPVLDQVQVQNDVQDTSQYSSVEESPWEGREDDTEGNQVREDSPAALIQQKNQTLHVCLNNPQSTCPRRGMICLDLLNEFVAKFPGVLSTEQIEQAVITVWSSAKQSTVGQLSQTDANDPLSSQHEDINWRTASTSPNATASTSSSPSGSCLSPQSDSVTTSSSFVGTVGSSTGKRQRSEDYAKDRPQKQQRKPCTDRDDVEPDCNCKKRAPDGGQKRRKKKPVDGKFICLICEILGDPYPPLSRKDALKRHIAKLHALFAVLLEPVYYGFGILKPRKDDVVEDIVPLIAFCITLQSQARQRGVEIAEEQDLAFLHPTVAASLNRS